MSNILAICPIKKNIHPAIRQLAEQQLQSIGCEFVLDDRGPGDADITGLSSRAEHVAHIRQEIVNENLKSHHDFIFMVDADVKYFGDIPRRLIALGGNNVVAPLVLLDKMGSRFYDTAGFVSNGKWASHLPPYFEGDELDSVGCCYIIPAEVFRRGACYLPSDAYTEHYSVCQFAKRMGYKVSCARELVVCHLFLTDYGEKWH